jgi:hypothetical protein
MNRRLTSDPSRFGVPEFISSALLRECGVRLPLRRTSRSGAPRASGSSDNLRALSRHRAFVQHCESPPFFWCIALPAPVTPWGWGTRYRIGKIQEQATQTSLAESVVGVNSTAAPASARRCLTPGTDEGPCLTITTFGQTVHWPVPPRSALD